MPMAHQRRIPRTRSQLPTCYHEGFLEKRSFKDKVSRNLWTSLCGNTLFFYNNNKENDYLEKVDLSSFISLSDDLGFDRHLESARFHLRLKNDDLYLTAPSLEARELWKGYIYSVAKLVVPNTFNLLPGQKRIMSEVVEKEKDRLKEASEKPKPASKPVATPGSNIYETILSEMPECYHLVSRGDAEILLEMNQEKGNLLLRPSQDGNSFAVTTRLELNGPVFKHYKVTRTCDGGFAIAVETPISCKNLDDVINCLLEKTGGVLKPLDLDHTYEEAIVYVQANEESGEKSLQCAPNNSTPPKVPPKPGNVPANEDGGEKSLQPAPKNPTPPKPPPKPAQNNKELEPEENIYLNSDEEECFDSEPFVSPPVHLPRPGQTMIHQASLPERPFGAGGALLPPHLRRHSSTAAPETKPKPRFPIPIQENLSQCLNKELKEKLKKTLVMN